jgi:acyl dehydratase
VSAPTIGDELPTRLVTSVRDEDIRIVALILRDPNPIHFDLDAVAKAGLGERAINQGGATMAYVMNLLTGWAGSRGALRRIDCSFRGNVAAGDDVQVGARVTAVEPVPEGHLVDLDVWAEVVGGRRAVVGTATVLKPAHP